MDIKKIGLGTAALSGDGGGYGFGTSDDPKELLEYAYEIGITYYDTAPIYGFSHAEKVLGAHIKKIREKIKIISKSGVSWHSNKRVNMTNDPSITKKMLYQSLKDLQTDYIDHYMIHWPDQKIDIRFPLEVLAKAQIEGKIKHIGLCNTNDEDYKMALEIVNIESVQFECNLFNNAFSDFNGAKEEALFKMGWGTFDKGILAGSVDINRIFEKTDARSWAPWWKKSNWKEKSEFVKKYQKEIFDYALAFSMQNTDLSLCGAKTIKQLDQINNSLNNKIDKTKLEDLYNEFSSLG